MAENIKKKKLYIFTDLRIESESDLYNGPGSANAFIGETPESKFGSSIGQK